jgi:colicin import membrane protein
MKELVLLKFKIENKNFWKHYEMKKAQEEASAKAAEAAESERFAEQLFNEREEWRKRAEAAEKARAELKAKAEPPPAALTKPDPEKYYDDKRNFRAFDYANDLAEYTAKKAIADDRAEQEKAARAKAEEAQKAEFTKRIAKATEKYPDWQKVVGGSDLVLQNQALQYLS